MNNLIFVLEDNEEILSIITMVLEEEELVVKGAGTVSEFYSLLPNLSPALCLLDVMLPDGNGLEVCQQLKQGQTTAHLPVIIMTANTEIEKMKETSNADDYIPKPFDIDDLAKRINNLIEHSKKTVGQL
jgi:DNA-binding response OmpR family regulator